MPLWIGILIHESRLRGHESGGKSLGRVLIPWASYYAVSGVVVASLRTQGWIAGELLEHRYPSSRSHGNSRHPGRFGIQSIQH